MREKIEALIVDAFSEISETRDDKIPTDQLVSLVLYGDAGIFDSMQLVNYLLLLEEKIAETLSLTLSLTSERAVSRRVSPFRSATHLADFIMEEIELGGAAGSVGESAVEEIAR
jgi:acyl carrier protein